MLTAKVRAGDKDVVIGFDTQDELIDFLDRLESRVQKPQTAVASIRPNGNGNVQGSRPLTIAGKFAPISTSTQVDIIAEAVRRFGRPASAREITDAVMSNPAFKTRSSKPINIVRGALASDSRITKTSDGQWDYIVDFVSHPQLENQYLDFKTPGEDPFDPKPH